MRSLVSIALCLASASTSSFAWESKMIVDPSFGVNIPRVDAKHVEIAPIGFVHLPVSGGYVFFTEQAVGSSSRLVATRFTENGSLDMSWPPGRGGGNQLVPLPPPDVDYSSFISNARVAVTVSSLPPRIDEIYIVEKFTSCDSSGCTPNLFVGLMNSAGEITANVSQTILFFPGRQWSITALATGLPTRDGIGEWLVVQANGTDVSEALTIFHNPPPALPALEIQDVYPIDGSGIGARFTDIRSNSAGTSAGLIGMRLNQAFYAGTLFSLSCPTGTAASSIIDSAEGALTSTDTIVTGRVDCGSDGKFFEVASVANIEDPSRVAVKDVSVVELLASDCVGSFTATGCDSSYLLSPTQTPASVYATTPSSSLAHIDVGTEQVDYTGRDTLNPARQILASRRFGAYVNYPYLVGTRYDSDSSGTPSIGLGRFIIDRIAADGFGN